MVKIRLMRIGTKGRPFYRVVAVDSREKRTGAYIELLGTYNPLTNPKEIILKQDKIDEWVKKGAVLSDGFLRIIGQAKQRPPRKPKKEKKESPEVTPEPVEKPEETTTEEVVKEPEEVKETTDDSEQITDETPVEAEAQEKLEEPRPEDGQPLADDKSEATDTEEAK